MRDLLSIRRLAFVLVALAGFASSTSAQSFNSEAYADDHTVSWQVRGFGRTAQEAEENALRQAHTQIVNELRERGVVDWEPTLAFLRKEGAIQLLGDPRNVVLEQNGVVSESRVQVTLAPRHFTAIGKKAKQSRIQYRHELLAVILLGVVLSLLVLTSYLGLEEKTKGFYTNTLRGVAIGVVAILIGCLWWWWTY